MICVTPSELISYSLAQQGTSGQEDSNTELYQIHDMVLDYLKDSVPKDKQVLTHSLTHSLTPSHTLTDPATPANSSEIWGEV